jgi:glycosyltransferase involved in cell wall biosynthesis
MKFLFTAPRFHTNQVPIVKGLIEKGHEVRYFVAFIGATEDHSLCKPLILKPSWTTVWEKKTLVKTQTPSEVESAIGGHFIPNYEFLKDAFEDYMPDIVVCREKTNLTLCVKALCDEHDIPCILYDQDPLYQLKDGTKKASAVQKAKSSIWKRIATKLDRTLNMDRRMLKKMRMSSGFPTVRMTPVKYSRLPRELSESTASDNTYFIPFVAESHPEASERRYCPDGMLRILCVGKFREYKNVKLLVEAATMLNMEEDWTMTIVGQAMNGDEQKYYEETKSMIATSGAENRITLKTNVPYDTMGEIYLQHDVFVLPSKKEVASIAVIEAMSYGLAVISTDYNGTASYVEDANCGAVFATEDAKDLAEKIKSLSHRSIREYGQNARRKSVDDYSFEKYYNALGQMMKMAID